MTKLSVLIRAGLIALLGTLVSPTVSIAGKPKEPIILEKTYDATVDQVYAAEVQAAGPTLINSVKEACVVNFKIAEDFGNGLYRVIWWTATCKDAGGGKTNVTLAAQINSNSFFGNGGSKKGESEVFWKNIDAALKNVPSASPKVMSQAGSEGSILLQVSSDPSGADITLDGDYAGSTPSQVKVKAGTHSVKITKKGFQPWERSIKVETGESRRVDAELEKSN